MHLVEKRGSRRCQHERKTTCSFLSKSMKVSDENSKHNERKRELFFFLGIKVEIRSEAFLYEIFRGGWYNRGVIAETHEISIPPLKIYAQ